MESRHRYQVEFITTSALFVQPPSRDQLLVARRMQCCSTIGLCGLSAQEDTTKDTKSTKVSEYDRLMPSLSFGYVEVDQPARRDAYQFHVGQ